MVRPLISGLPYMIAQTIPPGPLPLTPPQYAASLGHPLLIFFLLVLFVSLFLLVSLCCSLDFCIESNGGTWTI